MNPIAHAALGLHIANLGFYQHYGRRALLILATASVFPDIDVVTLLVSREAYYQFHRGFTHSLGGWIVCGALLALLTAHRDLRHWFFSDWGLWALGMMGHTAADLINRWPIPVFYPLSHRRWAFPLVSWGDGFLTGTWLILAIAVPLLPKHRRSIAVAALAIGGLYLGYRIFVPAAGPSWLSTLWFGLWMR